MGCHLLHSWPGAWARAHWRAMVLFSGTAACATVSAGYLVLAGSLSVPGAFLAYQPALKTQTRAAWGAGPIGAAKPHAALGGLASAVCGVVKCWHWSPGGRSIAFRPCLSIRACWRPAAPWSWPDLPMSNPSGSPSDMGASGRPGGSMGALSHGCDARWRSKGSLSVIRQGESVWM